jgi:hypothetical protein
MTEETPSAIGTVAQEAARLIEDLAAMARSSTRGFDDSSPYAGEQAPEPGAPEASRPHHGASSAGDREAGDRSAGGRQRPDESSSGVCSVCGADGDDTPSSCRICPLCRGIALLRSVRPETVDLLADLALSIATGLRDVASRSRASAPPPPSRPGSSGPADGERTTVQDIHVDDESE